jgi:hypothetical protein
MRRAELEMARELRWWVASLLAAGGVIVAAYVPPRGVAPVVPPSSGQPQPTAARLRAQALARKWRDADLAVRLAQYRRQLAPELARRREHDEPGPVVLVEAPDSLAPRARQVVTAALDTLWRELGLGVSKVGVGVVVDFWRQRPTRIEGTPQRNLYSAGHLLPDSIDRTTCIALIPAGMLHASDVRNSRVQDWLRSGLGPCAFFAAWGVPGAGVRHWLGRRQYDLARVPTWDLDGTWHPEWLSVMLPSAVNAPPSWYWPAVYGHPIATIGCLAGRAASCRAAVLSGAGASDEPLSRLLGEDDWSWWRDEPLVPVQRYLSDVAREVGHDRFLRFWNSPEPVDTALAAALKMSVGKWTERWERRYVPQLPLGAATPLSTGALGIVLGAAALVLVARGAIRRQVR